MAEGMNREDLRVLADLYMPPKLRPVSDAELAELGYVKRPVCGECKGDGVADGYEWASGEPTPPCPSCGGSGFGRLVKLDGIDLEHLNDLRGSLIFLSDANSRDTVMLIDRVLAALEGDTP